MTSATSTDNSIDAQTMVITTAGASKTHLPTLAMVSTLSSMTDWEPTTDGFSSFKIDSDGLGSHISNGISTATVSQSGIQDETDTSAQEALVASFSGNCCLTQSLK